LTLGEPPAGPDTSATGAAADGGAGGKEGEGVEGVVPAATGRACRGRCTAPPAATGIGAVICLGWLHCTNASSSVHTCAQQWHATLHALTRQPSCEATAAASLSSSSVAAAAAGIVGAAAQGAHAALPPAPQHRAVWCGWWN